MFWMVTQLFMLCSPVPAGRRPLCVVIGVLQPKSMVSMRAVWPLVPGRRLRRIGTDEFNESNGFGVHLLHVVMFGRSSPHRDRSWVRQACRFGPVLGLR